jgi:hypothetical protein
VKRLWTGAVIIPLLLLLGAQGPGVPVEPGGSDTDTQTALANPDEYAWQLFMYISRQAIVGQAGVPDPNKQFGQLDPDASVVWETWALASGGPSASEVYRAGGVPPLPWDKLDRSQQKLILDENLEQEMVARESQRTKIAPFFFPTKPLDQEVRMNKVALENITQKGMYSRDGLEALLAQASPSLNRSFIQMDRGAKEVKAQWSPITDAMKPRYLWHYVTAPDGSKQAYGLVSLHIITKDLPNWFWADFGHVDCESQSGACANQPTIAPEAALTCPVDTTTRGNLGVSSCPLDPQGRPSSSGPAGTDGVRKETVGTVWANYILRGTQTGFTTTTGTATILSNPVIEAWCQKSSCMTCHARAAVGPRLVNPNGKPSSAINLLSPGDPELGAPNPAMFGDYAGFNNPSIMYLQSDFMWSPVFRSQRKTTP